MTRPETGGPSREGAEKPPFTAKESQRGIPFCTANFAAEPPLTARQQETRNDIRALTNLALQGGAAADAAILRFTELGPRVTLLRTKATKFNALEVAYTGMTPEEIQASNEVIRSGHLLRIPPDQMTDEDYFLRHSLNTIGVRERFQVVKYLVGGAIKERRIPDRQEGIGIISIACGSSRAVLEAMKETDVPTAGVPQSRGFLLDIDSNALGYSSHLAGKMEIEDRIETARENFFQPDTTVSARGRTFAIAEKVGLDDYLDDEQLVDILQRTASLLEPGGTIIFGNIQDNPERDFLHKVIGWPNMVYRTPDDLARIVPLAFPSPADAALYEVPSKLYTVAQVTPGNR